MRLKLYLDMFGHPGYINPDHVIQLHLVTGTPTLGPHVRIVLSDGTDVCIEGTLPDMDRAAAMLERDEP